MKKGMVLLLLLCSMSVFAGDWTQQQLNEYNTCFPILKELRWIKAMRDQNMETAGPKTLAEIEKDWKDKSRHHGCYAWDGEFNRRNP